MKKFILTLIIFAIYCTFIQVVEASTIIKDSNYSTVYTINSNGNEIRNKNNRKMSTLSADGRTVYGSNNSIDYRISSNRKEIKDKNNRTVYYSNKPLTNTQILTIVSGLRR